MQLWRTIPREQTLVLRSEDMFEAPAAQLRRVTEFLGLAPFELESYDAWKATPFAPMPSDVHDRLTEYYRPRNDALAVGWAPEYSWDGWAVAPG